MVTSLTRPAWCASFRRCSLTRSTTWLRKVHVGVSFEEPEYTANADGIGALRLLEAIRILGLEKKTQVLPSLYV
jgi:hypothetical protein